VLIHYQGMRSGARATLFPLATCYILLQSNDIMQCNASKLSQSFFNTRRTESVNWRIFNIYLLSIAPIRLVGNTWYLLTLPILLGIP